MDETFYSKNYSNKRDVLLILRHNPKITHEALAESLGGLKSMIPRITNRIAREIHQVFSNIVETRYNVRYDICGSYKRRQLQTRLHFERTFTTPWTR